MLLQEVHYLMRTDLLPESLFNTLFGQLAVQHPRCSTLLSRLFIFLSRTELYDGLNEHFEYLLIQFIISVCEHSEIGFQNDKLLLLALSGFRILID